MTADSETAARPRRGRDWRLFIPKSVTVIAQEGYSWAKLRADALAGLTVAMEWHGGTLTSTNPSAVDLLREVGHPAFETYWQPPLYQTPEYCLEGLEGVLKQVRHLHVFNWYPTSNDHVSLAAGEANWKRYLTAFAKAPLPGEHFAFLEHVHGESREGLLSEAKTLLAWAKKYS